MPIPLTLARVQRMMTCLPLLFIGCCGASTRVTIGCCATWCLVHPALKTSWVKIRVDLNPHCVTLGLQWLTFRLLSALHRPVQHYALYCCMPTPCADTLRGRDPCRFYTFSAAEPVNDLATNLGTRQNGTVTPTACHGRWDRQVLQRARQQCPCYYGSTEIVCLTDLITPIWVRAEL